MKSELHLKLIAMTKINTEDRGAPDTIASTLKYTWNTRC